MKYQIYLNKEISELLNAIANELKMKPATFIKVFVEGSFNALENLKDDSIAVKGFMEALKNGNGQD